MDIEDIKSEWLKGKAWIDNFTRDFSTLETLADGIATQNQKGAPKVGIVTLSNAVRQIPRNSVQQNPTFSMSVNGTKESIDAIVLSYLLRSVVFNEDTFGNGVLATIQMGAQTALTQGFTVLRANTGKLFNKFSTTLETRHYNDIVNEPGVFDASNSGYYHVRTRVTKGALKRVLDAAKKNKNTQWDVGALQELYDAGAQQVNYNSFLSPARTNQGNLGDQYDIITRYGVGSYYDIDVFSPQLDKKLMSFKSKSKFGYPRVSFLVIDPAQLSPFGVSRARLASPMANYGNIYLQSTAKMQLLNADAPVFKRGLFTSATPLRRGAVWESQDPNADIQIKELSNSTLNQFSSVMSYIDQQILSTMGVAGVGTPQANSAYQNSAAIQERTSVQDISSKQVSSLIENSLRQYALTAIDLYVSEQSGQVQLIVDDEAKDAINDIEGEGFVGDDNVVNIDWTQLYKRIQTWTVDIDLSVSKSQLADKKRADLQDMFTVMKQTAGQDPAANAQANAIGKELVEETLPEMSKAMEEVPAAPQMQPMQPYGGGANPTGQ